MTYLVKYKDYFELFELQPSLWVDRVFNQKKYYQLSKEFHPDNFTLSSEEEQKQVLQLSADINKAKKILDNAYLRLEYFLRLHSVVQDEEKYELSPTFLGEMMDINEQLMELEFEPDEARKENIKVDLKKMESEIQHQVSHLLEAKSMIANQEEFQQLKDYYYKKKYLVRVAEKM